MDTQRFSPGLFDRLLDDHVRGAPATWTLDHLKDAVARDLESLLNTRAAMPEHLFAPFPEASKSVLTYGLTDFAGMCMSSDADRKKICAAVLLTIERHEPRLQGVTATLRQRGSQINRFDFVIAGKLRAQFASDLLYFDAVLEPATQQYSIRKS
jgi:type VI secretion system protein ImpF